MPELPEVETIRRQLCDAGVVERTIEKISIHWPRTVEPLAPAAFRKKLSGKRIKALSRHGKWLIFELDGIDNLLVHLRMTGGFYLSEGVIKKGPYDRVVLKLSGNVNLHFRDPRKFGRMRIAPFPAGLGPDALNLQTQPFLEALKNSNRMLKPLLLDQSVVAGIGNIYADEALFAAGLRPGRRCSSCSADEKQALGQAVRDVIGAAVRNGGTSLGIGKGNYKDLNGNAGGHRDQAKVYGRAGKPCVACATLLEKTKIAQRTTVFCPRCQK